MSNPKLSAYTTDPKIDEIVEKRKRNLDALYEVRGMKNVPLYDPATQREQIEAVEKTFQSELEQLAELTRAEVEAAEAKLARLENPYNWLTATEAAHAESLTPYVREDIDACNSLGDLMRLARRMAASDGKAGKWVALRYIPQRVDALLNEGKFDPENPGSERERIDLLAALTSLRRGVTPAGWETSYNAAKEARDKARYTADGATMTREIMRP